MITTHHWIAIALAALASASDIRTRRIPNALTFGAAGAALLYWFSTLGLAGALTSAGGWGTACALFLPFFALGGLGAGDVKLAAAIGAWLGPADALWMSLMAMIAGGIMGVIVAVGAGYLRQATQNIYLLLQHWRVGGIRPMPELTLAAGKGPRLPYALPIAAGTVAAIFWR